MVFLGFLGAFFSGYFLRASLSPLSSQYPLLSEAYNILENHEYEVLPEERELEYGMIRGMLQASNDPHAAFLEPVQNELQSNNLQGSFGGIGVELSKTEEGDILVFPIENGPAAVSGVLMSDRLLSVDDLIINPATSLEDVVAAIRGPEGTVVAITVSRASSSTSLEFQIKRQPIHLPSITWRSDLDNPQVGILKVNLIAESTPDELKDAVESLQDHGADRFILDLRDNGGGLLSAGIETARLFLEEGDILEQQYKGQAIETFDVKSPGPLSDMPLAVLINGSTASAAEIIAGALQAHGKAMLIGEPSYGKDSVQLIFDLQDDSSIRVTAAKWWIPGLQPPVSEHGLQPDIQVPPDDSDLDPVLSAAVEFLLQQ